MNTGLLETGQANPFYNYTHYQFVVTTLSNVDAVTESRGIKVSWFQY